MPVPLAHAPGTGPWSRRWWWAGCTVAGSSACGWKSEAGSFLTGLSSELETAFNPSDLFDGGPVAECSPRRFRREWRRRARRPPPKAAR